MSFCAPKSLENRRSLHPSVNVPPKKDDTMQHTRSSSHRLHRIAAHLHCEQLQQQPGAVAAPTAAPMTIAKVDTIYTKPAWIFVKITTSTGLVGWGEASYGGRDRAAGVAVEEAARYLLGTCVAHWHWPARRSVRCCRGLRPPALWPHCRSPASHPPNLSTLILPCHDCNAGTRWSWSVTCSTCTEGRSAVAGRC